MKILSTNHSDWDLTRIKYLATYNDEVLPDNTEPDLEINYVEISDVDHVNGITNSQKLLFEKAPSRARRVIRKGDTIVSTVRTYLKAIAYVNEENDESIASTGFAVIRPIDERKIHPKYLGYCFQDKRLIGDIVSNSVGVSYPAINASVLVRLSAYQPPYAEQTLIARFLDQKTSQIDQLIEQKEKLLKLLAEKRTAIITQAVTKGLDPDVEMKDSGIDWLGETPKGWAESKIGYDYHVQLGKMVQPDPKDEDEQYLFYLRAANVYWSGPNLKSLKSMWFSPNDIKKYNLKKGDLLISEGGDVGRSCIWNKDHEMYFQNALNRVRGSEKGDVEYLYFWMVFLKQSGFIDIICNGSTIAHYTAEKVKATPFLRPGFMEQGKIVDYIKERTEKIDQVTLSINNSIIKLKEYREALITAAVTGQIDVRKELIDG